MKLGGIMLAFRQVPPVLWKPPLAALLCVAASWVIRLQTGGIKVDQNLPSLGVSIVTTVLFLSALIVISAFLVKTCLGAHAAPLEVAQVRTAAFLTCAVSVPMLPMLSNDVFSVLTYGDLALRGVDTFVNPADLSRSAFFGYVGDHWKSAPCVYGPVTLVIAAASVWLGMGNIYLALLVFKLFALGAGLILVQYAYRCVLEHPEKAGWKTLALVSLSPILWLQGTGQAHNDLFGGMFLMMGIFYMAGDRYRLAALWVICAVLTKLSALVGLFFYVTYLYGATRTHWRSLLKELTIALFIMALVSIAFYAPFWWGAKTLTVPISFLAEKPPWNSLVWLSSGLYLPVKTFLSSLWSQGPAVIDRVRELYADPVFMLKEKHAARDLFRLVFLFMGLGLSAVQMIPFIRQGTPGAAFTASTRISVIVFTIIPAVFYSWYLVVILPFFITKMPQAWTVWLVSVSVVSSGLDIRWLTDHESFVFRLLDPMFTCATVFLFLCSLRERFFRWHNNG